MITLKIDPRMKKALDELADKQLTPVSVLLRQLIDRYLQDHGIEWREEEPEK